MLDVKAMAMLGRSLIMLVIRVIVGDATASTDYRAFMSRQFSFFKLNVYIFQWSNNLPQQSGEG